MNRYRNSLGYKVYMAPRNYNLANISLPTDKYNWLDYHSTLRALYKEIPVGFDTYNDQTHIANELVLKLASDPTFKCPFTVINRPHNLLDPAYHPDSHFTLQSYDIKGFAVSVDFKKIIIYGTSCAHTTYYTTVKGARNDRVSQDAGTYIGLFDRTTGKSILNSTYAGRLERYTPYSGPNSAYRDTFDVGPIVFSIHLEYAGSKARIISFRAKSLPDNYFTSPGSNVTVYNQNGEPSTFRGDVLNYDLDKVLSEPTPEFLMDFNVDHNTYYDSIVISANNESYYDPSYYISRPGSTLYVGRNQIYDMVHIGNLFRKCILTKSDDYDITRISSGILNYKSHQEVYDRGRNEYSSVSDTLSILRNSDL